MKHFARGWRLGALLLPFLASCATAPPIPTAATASDFCSVFAVVRYSKTDTPDTIAQVKANNAVWHRLCDKA